MSKRPSEVFGFPIEINTKDAQKARKKYWCPFVDQRCNKQSRLISYPMGVCSVQYGSNSVAICPRRFLQGNIVFQNIADHYFSTRNDIIVLSEVGLSRVGTFDYVMVKHKPFSREVEDFIVIEFQTGQTTGTGKLVKALEEHLQGKDIREEHYAFGLNLADIWKRTFTQVLNKGTVLEHWGNKIYWVVQEPVYQNFLDRYNLNTMSYDRDHSIIFMIHDLRESSGRYELFHTGMESSTTDDLFDAFRDHSNIPNKDLFTAKLMKRIEAKADIKPHIH